MLLLLTLAVADELLEDRLEQGNVPMYGQELYPISPDRLAARRTTPTPARAATPARVVAVTTERVPDPIKEDAELLLSSSPKSVPPPELSTEDDGPQWQGPLPGPEPSLSKGEGSYRQGFDAGKADARPNKWAFIGPILGAALFLPPEANVSGMTLGCVGGTVLGAVLPAAPDEGDWQLGSVSYQQGYEAGWKRSMRRRRALYTFSIGTAGTLLYVVRTEFL